MKRFILVFIALLFFDFGYEIAYNLFLVETPVPVHYLFSFIEIIISSPAIFVNRLYPFYAPYPIYLNLIILFGNILLQTFLVYKLTNRKTKTEY